MSDSSASWQKRAYAKYYHDRPDWQDGTMRFRRLIEGVVRPGAEILEIGSGPSNAHSQHLAGLGALTGLDIDVEVHSNEACSTTLVYDGIEFPCEEARFDAVVSNYVIEHVASPLVNCREVLRVLRPGGVYIFRAPNLWHYVSMVSRATPQWFHARFALWAQGATGDAHDPYPTYYRMNTRRACRRILEAAEFSVEHLECIEPEPAYGRFSRLAFYPLMAWERTVNATTALEGLRANILGVGRKSAANLEPNSSRESREC